MINPAQIPPEVVEAAAKAMIQPSPSLNWDNMPGFHSIWLDEARAAIAAALNAWPGADTHLYYKNEKHTRELTLPLSQEARE